MQGSCLRYVILVSLIVLAMAEAGPSLSAGDLPKAPPVGEGFLREFDRLREELQRLIRELDLGTVTKKEALRVVTGLRGRLQELRGRLANRLWKERPGSPKYKLLEEAMATLERLDRWLVDLQRQWEEQERRWI
ncbi:MAG: hypothetical protein ACUVXD_15885 [Thermodesulfobacteriota bacterium]